MLGFFGKSPPLGERSSSMNIRGGANQKFSATFSPTPIFLPLGAPIPGFQLPRRLEEHKHAQARQLLRAH